jgi:hypothetical protein
VIGDFCSRNMGSTTLERQSCSRPSWRCCSWQDAVGGFLCCRFIG